MKSIKGIAVVAVMALSIASSCKRVANTDPVTTEKKEEYVKISPDFSSDSAYSFIQKQVDFGFRIPNTKEHIACGNYLAAELKRFGAEVQEQKMTVTAYDGTKLNACNIIGTFDADKKKRVLLFAHWDTRPYSDQDPDPANHKKPVLGANDGGSGVGVLLEVARNIQMKSPEVGIDIIFFDAEDYGTPVFVEQEDLDDTTWCLGSHYWAKHKHKAGYKAKYGILLDMVGGKDAKFYKEYYSTYYAGDIVEKIWDAAHKLGYASYFVSKEGGGITDDHLPVNEVAEIPSANIIHFEPQKGFAHYWHTQKDDMSNVSKETLQAVGQTVLEVIYKEKE